jgi:DNA primase large subunit
MIMVLRAIKTFVVAEGFVLATSLYSKTLFANTQVAFLSSLFVIVGSSFAYKKMVENKIDSEAYESERDLLDTIEDPHELYDEVAINETPVEELDLKAIVKEEKAKIKTFSFQSIKHGVRGSVSMFRLLPYLFLVLGFIALKNNNLLDISFYLPSLLLGIIVGSLISKEITS